MIAALALALQIPALTVAKGEVDLTPPEPLALGGYTARQGKLFEPGGEPLLARCLVFSMGKMRLALVSVEMLTVPESLQREVAKRLPSDVALFLAATHTHCAPDSQMLNDRMTFALPGIASFREKWLGWYADKIATAVTTAKPWAKIERIWTEERRIDANRGRRKFAEPDTTATKVVGFGSQAYPLIFNYAAHATVYGSEELHTRPDWPGMVRGWGLFLPGAIGDVSPKADGPTVKDKLEDMRSRLYARVPYFESTVYAGKQRSFAYVETPIALGAVKAHPDFAKSNRIPDSLAQNLVGRFAPKEAHITSFRFGKLVVVGVPGEPTSELGRRIRDAGRRMGFAPVLVVSHVNGWMGYILAPEDYDRGGYEATLSFYGRDEGNRVVDAAIESMKALATSKDR